MAAVATAPPMAAAMVLPMAGEEPMAADLVQAEGEQLRAAMAVAAAVKG